MYAGSHDSACRRSALTSAAGSLNAAGVLASGGLLASASVPSAGGVIDGCYQTSANQGVGMLRVIGAASPQTVGGTTFYFSSWSDKGKASHTITTPATNTTYTVTFKVRGKR